MKSLIRYFVTALICLSATVAAHAQETGSLVSQSQKSIYQLVDQWSQAWRSQSINQYLVFYASSFQPENGLTQAQWKAQRQQRFFAADFVQLQIVNPSITYLHGDNATVEFTQNYRSSILQDQSKKTLQLIQEGGQWKIEREIAVKMR